VNDAEFHTLNLGSTPQEPTYILGMKVGE